VSSARGDFVFLWHFLCKIFFGLFIFEGQTIGFLTFFRVGEFELDTLFFSL